MVVDGRQLPNNERLETDLCIVGAGAAGLAIAREFAGGTVRVCLVESGGRSPSRKTQSLYRGVNRGPHYWPLVQSRMRTYGGSTTAWDGRCRPLDPIDFEARPWVPHSGWPLTRADLKPYYERAAALCRLAGTDRFDAQPAYGTSFFANSPSLATVQFRYAKVLNFAQAYGSQLEAAHNTQVLLHTNVVRVVTKPGGDHVSHLQAQTLTGQAFTITAKLFVLATGAIENARLLLASNQAHPAGLGNEHDVLGRFLMNHPHLFFAVLEPSATCPPLDEYLTDFDKPKTVTKAWAFSAAMLKQEQLVNCAVYITPRPKFKSMPAYLTKAMNSLFLALDARRLGNAPDDPTWHLRQILRGAPSIAASLSERLFNRSTQFVLRVALENAPNPVSRITLSSQRDALGQKRASVNWRLSPIDWHSYRKMAQQLKNEFEGRGFGSVKLFFDPDGEPWPLPVQDGKHHMGTTRMHIDPRLGVVDQNCRVHNIDNLSIAGSSVFPTSGHANPTLTIVALALRLADHLKHELSHS